MRDRQFSDEELKDLREKRYNKFKKACEGKNIFYNIPPGFASRGYGWEEVYPEGYKLIEWFYNNFDDLKVKMDMIEKEIKSMV